MWMPEKFSFERSTSGRRRAVESVALAVLFVGVPELAWTQAMRTVEPNPGWVAVLVLAARYGTAGLCLGLGVVPLVASLLALFTGQSFAAPWARLDALRDGAALGASVLVSWVGSRHLNRETRLREGLREASERTAHDERTIEALREGAAKLRSRVDRTSHSVSFLRDAAVRLQGADPIVAAEGAADLAIARSGGHGAIVRIGMRGHQRQLAIRDRRAVDHDEPLTLHPPDVTVPLRAGADCIGSLTCWGVPRAALDEATRNDLEVIASWCARAVIAGVRPSGLSRTNFPRPG